MVGLVIFVLLANDVPLSSYLEQIERDRLITTIQRDAFTIGGRLTPLMDVKGPVQTSEILVVLDDYASRSGGTVVVVDNKGYLTASNDPTKLVGDDYAGRPEVAAALLGTPTSGTRSSTTLGDDLMYAAVPVLAGTRVLGVVRVTYPNSLANARVNKYKRGILITAAISVAAAVIAALFFARFVTRSLDDLRSATEKFAGGDLDASAQESGPPETRKLATSFNLMARRLIRMIDQQRSFASDASHQLRTPLTALRLRLEQASDLLESKPREARSHLDEALSETERLARLIEQLLQLARAEVVTLQLEVLQITDLVTERAEQWASLAEERGVRLIVDITTPERGLGSGMALGEILDNYLDNALEVSPVGSTVRVITGDRSDMVEIVVRDEGPGLTEAQQARAFDRFWRGDEHSNRRLGSGLGLAIVSLLANASNFRVELRESPQGGIDAVVGVPRATTDV